MRTKNVLVVVLLAVLPACGSGEKSNDVEVAQGEEQADKAPLGFTVRLSGTSEDLLQPILLAGHDEIVPLCQAETSDTEVRIFIEGYPYADISCASILSSEPAGEAFGPLTKHEDEHIAEVRQPWSPFGIACSILTTGAGLIASYALCPRAPTPDKRKRCDMLTTPGFIGFGVACWFI